MDKKKWLQSKILGVKVDFVSMNQAVNWVEEQVNYNKVGQIVTPNPEQVILAKADKEFAQALNNADLAICDGIGLVWAAKRKLKIKSQKSKVRRLSGMDLMLALCQKAAQRRWRVFLLGGDWGVARKTAKQLTINNQQLAINYFSGSKDIKNESPVEREKVIKCINQFRPHLLFVAYGAPYQEKWIAKNLPYLKVNVAMGVGGAFDYLTGRVRRAPTLIRGLGLEWFWRLAREPWRIKRQLALLKFGWLVIREKVNQ